MISMLMKLYVLAFSFEVCIFCLVRKFSSLPLGHRDILFLLLKIFVALMFAFKSLIYLELIFYKR